MFLVTQGPLSKSIFNPVFWVWPWEELFSNVLLSQENTVLWSRIRWSYNCISSPLSLQKPSINQPEKYTNLIYLFITYFCHPFFPSDVKTELHWTMSLKELILWSVSLTCENNLLCGFETESGIWVKGRKLLWLPSKWNILLITICFFFKKTIVEWIITHLWHQKLIKFWFFQKLISYLSQLNWLPLYRYICVCSCACVRLKNETEYLFLIAVHFIHWTQD